MHVRAAVMASKAQTFSELSKLRFNTVLHSF